LIRLAHAQPELRADLVPLLKQATDDEYTSMGVSPDEAEALSELTEFHADDGTMYRNEVWVGFNPKWRTLALPKGWGGPKERKVADAMVRAMKQHGGMPKALRMLENRLRERRLQVAG